MYTPTTEAALVFFSRRRRFRLIATRRWRLVREPNLGCTSASLASSFYIVPILSCFGLEILRSEPPGTVVALGFGVRHRVRTIRELQAMHPVMIAHGG